MCQFVMKGYQLIRRCLVGGVHFHLRRDGNDTPRRLRKFILRPNRRASENQLRLMDRAGKLDPTNARFSPAPPRYSYFSSFSPSMNPAKSSTVGGSEPSSLCSNNALCFARSETNCSWPMLPKFSVLVESSSSLVTLMLIVLDAKTVLSVDGRQDEAFSNLLRSSLQQIVAVL